jgi:uncharacterized protein
MYLRQGFKGLNDWWRYLLGIVIVFTFYFLGQFPMVAVQYYRMEVDKNIGSDALHKFEKTMDFSIFGIDKNVGFLLLLLMFVFAFGGLYIVMTKLHNKKFINFINPLGKVNTSKILFGFVLWMGLSLISECISFGLSPELYEFRFQLGSFIPLLLISLFILPIQTSFEELFFRGYLMQGFVFLSQNKWACMLLSSILFGAVHMSNPEVAKFGIGTMAFYYIFAGLFLAYITVMDDSLELALGVHAATNFFGAAIFTYEGSVLQTDSLFILHEIKPWFMIVGFMVTAFIFILICNKKYHWPTLLSLNDPIKNESTNNEFKIIT